MQTAGATAWTGAVLLIGGIAVALVVNALLGLVLAALGGAALAIARRGGAGG